MNKFSFTGLAANHFQKSLTASDFFLKYQTKAEFNQMDSDLKEFAPKMRFNFQSFVNLSHRGYKIDSLIESREHLKTSMPYLFFTLDIGNKSAKVMLYNADGIEKFVSDCQSQLVKVDFTFEELIAEAQK